MSIQSCYFYHFKRRTVHNMSLKYGFHNSAASMKCAVFNYFASVSTLWLSGWTRVLSVCVCMYALCVCVFCVWVIVFSFYSFFLLYFDLPSWWINALLIAEFDMHIFHWQWLAITWLCIKCKLFPSLFFYIFQISPKVCYSIWNAIEQCEHDENPTCQMLVGS